MKKIFSVLILVSISVSAQLQWRPVPTLSDNINNQRFDDIFFLNDNVGWAANGAYATLYKTTNGGATWQIQLSEFSATLPGNHYFRSVEFLNENIGFVGTLNNKFLRTVDGGANWTVITAFGNVQQSICGIAAVGTSTVYGCGAYYAPAYLIKSTDSGANWQYIDMSAYANALVEIMFTDENTGYVAGNDNNGGVILKTTDGGLTWNSIFNTNVPGEYVWKLQRLFSNTDVIVGSVEGVADNPGKFIRSLDNGITWSVKDAPESIIQGVGFISPDHGWMGGHTTGFYETTDGGTTWTNTGVGNNLNRIFVINDHLAYAAGSTVYKFSEEQLATVSVQGAARVPLRAFVQPNPVKDKLNIKIEFTENDHLRLDLYDVTGRLIKELQRENINAAGARYFSFDFPYENGIYFVSIHTNTGRQTVKFTK